MVYRVWDKTRGAVEARHLGIWSDEKGLEKSRSPANMTELFKNRSSWGGEGEPSSRVSLADLGVVFGMPDVEDQQTRQARMITSTPT